MHAALAHHRLGSLLAIAALAALLAVVFALTQRPLSDARTAHAQTGPAGCGSLTVPLATGFNLVGLLDAAAPDAVTPSATAIFGWDANAQQYDTWRPGLPPSFNTLASVDAGAAVWVFLDGGPSSITLPIAPQATRLATMSTGWNLVTWTGPNATSAWDAFSPQAFGAQTAPQSPFVAAMSFDNRTQRFTTFDPRLPDALNDLTDLNFGDPVWLNIVAAAAWSIPAGDPCDPAANDGAASGDAAAGCDDQQRTFAYAPVDLDAIEFVVPLGLMSDSHVTPVDHQYFQNYKDPQRLIAVYTPAAGTVTQIQHMTQSISDEARAPIDDYRLVIEHGCGLSSIYIHVGELAPALAAAAPEPGGYTSASVTVAAGEQIGAFRGNVDYNVVDTTVTLTGLLVPEHYDAEPWKIHAPNSFTYFTDAIREQLVAKSLRTAEPVGGRFDYDVDGLLVGTWFQEGTNGYAGAGQARYWAGHLAVAYNHLDPSLIVLSLGTFDGASAQFAVRGNAPNPTDVSIDTGPVAYELVRYEYWIDDVPWDRVSLVQGLEARGLDDQVYGVVLFELLAPRQLMVEIFVGKTADQVDGFTAAALIYER